MAALLDWEFCHFSDAAEDLVFARQFIEQLIPWPEFMRLYNAGGGADYTPEVARFFEVWKEVRNAETCLGSLILMSVQVEPINPRPSRDAAQGLVA